MIRIVRGDIFRDDAAALVDPVNCIGVSGKGLAKEFAKRFPEAEAYYRGVCKHGLMRLGEIEAFRDASGKWIVFFPTKGHWRDDSTVKGVADGLVDLRAWLEAEKPASIALPALGCGNGNLLWPEVRPMISRALAALDTDVRLYAPLE